MIVSKPDFCILIISCIFFISESEVIFLSLLLAMLWGRESVSWIISRLGFSSFLVWWESSWIVRHHLWCISMMTAIHSSGVPITWMTVSSTIAVMAPISSSMIRVSVATISWMNTAVIRHWVSIRITIDCHSSLWILWAQLSIDMLVNTLSISSDLIIDSIGRGNLNESLELLWIYPYVRFSLLDWSFLFNLFPDWRYRLLLNQFSYYWLVDNGCLNSLTRIDKLMLRVDSGHCMNLWCFTLVCIHERELLYGWGSRCQRLGRSIWTFCWV